MERLYEKIGFNKEIISRGRYAELTAAEQRPFRYVEYGVAKDLCQFVFHINLKNGQL